MAEAISKSRQAAEAAFNKVQSQSIARARAVEEADSIKIARDEKTQRLRAARLEQAQRDAALADGLLQPTEAEPSLSSPSLTPKHMRNNAK